MRREPEIAFNGAADRIEKQLRRYTSRLKDHKVDEDGAGLRRERGLTRSLPAGADDGGGGTGRRAGDRRRDADRHSPIERLRRGHADGPAQHTGADVQEQRTGEFNMIYRREDGNIGWVEPHDD